MTEAHPSFKLKGQEVRRREVEIEAKSGEGARTVGSLTKEPRDMAALDLNVWVHGKLANGRAIKEIVDAGRLKTLLCERDNLNPGAYPKVEADIRDRDISIL